MGFLKDSWWILHKSSKFLSFFGILEEFLKDSRKILWDSSTSESFWLDSCEFLRDSWKILEWFFINLAKFCHFWGFLKDSLDLRLFDGVLWDSCGFLKESWNSVKESLKKLKNPFKMAMRIGRILKNPCVRQKGRSSAMDGVERFSRVDHLKDPWQGWQDRKIKGF